MNAFERTIAELLRPPVRAYRGEAVERLAVARDRVTLVDALTGTLRSPESRVSYALVGYSEVGWTDYSSAPVEDAYAGSDLIYAGDESINAGADPA